MFELPFFGVLLPHAASTSNIFGNKFYRRPDLTVFDWLQIVYEAYCAFFFGLWGTVTVENELKHLSLAERYYIEIEVKKRFIA
ncbi:MAG: hypothetical protein D3923_02395 [Candidatus Electrothrix sp. AR3]|nr:hypothetical protein [Candidatus Electrothrix sp. AR3]